MTAGVEHLRHKNEPQELKMLESSLNVTRSDTRGASRVAITIAGTTAALAAAALYNTYRARKVERDHPPAGRFVTVDGVRLHYLEKGVGSPVVLLHGNLVTAEDFVLSGVFDLVAARHRVIAFDRPGYGFSDRPRGSIWTPAEQADLLRQAFAQLGVERAVVVGHSWGALVALALALDHPDAVSGLVLVSGYYDATVRLDVPLASLPAIPLIGDLMRYTVSPLLGAAAMPSAVRGMFAPCSVAERFAKGFPYGFSVRPWQIRAESQEAASMVPAVAAMASRYRELRMPVTLMAGRGDLVVDYESHSVWLHEQLPDTTVLCLIKDAGHMVHYAVPDAVADAIEAVSRAVPVPPTASRSVA